MQSDPRVDYWWQVRKELNPTFFETDWLSHQIMGVEWSLFGSATDATVACIEGIKVLLEARRLDRSFLEQIVADADTQEEVKAQFSSAFEDPEFSKAPDASEELCRLAIYCYLRVAYTYTR